MHLSENLVSFLTVEFIQIGLIDDVTTRNATADFLAHSVYITYKLLKTARFWPTLYASAAIVNYFSLETLQWYK